MCLTIFWRSNELNAIFLGIGAQKSQEKLSNDFAEETFP